MQKQKLPSLNIKKKKTSNIRKKEKTSEIPSDNSTDFDSSIDNVTNHYTERNASVGSIDAPVATRIGERCLIQKRSNGGTSLFRRVRARWAFLSADAQRSRGGVINDSLLPLMRPSSPLNSNQPGPRLEQLQRTIDNVID